MWNEYFYSYKFRIIAISELFRDKSRWIRNKPRAIHTSGDITLSPRVIVCGLHLQGHVNDIKELIWLAADACLKEVEGKNEQDGRVAKAVFTPLRFVFLGIFYTVQAYEGINYVRLFTCWSFWRHRSFHVGSRRRNWRRFVIRFVVRLVIILSSRFVVSKQTHFDLQLESLIALSYIHPFWHTF